MLDSIDWNKTRLGLSLLHGLPRRVFEQQNLLKRTQGRQGSSGSHGDHRIQVRSQRNRNQVRHSTSEIERKLKLVEVLKLIESK